MKTCVLILLTAILACSGQQSQSQTIVMVSHHVDPMGYQYDFGVGKFISNVRLNEISPRAFRHFAKNYSTGIDEQWIRTSKGIVASYSQNYVTCRIVYSEKGNFIYSLKYYEGQFSAEALKKIIAFSYPGFSIKNVVEFYDGYHTTYGLTITNQHTNKALEFYNGEIRVLEEYTSEK